MRAYSFGWFSHRLGRHMEFLHLGHAGAPVVVFPTGSDDLHEFQDRGMLEPLAWKIDKGLIQVFCISGINRHSWLDTTLAPRARVEAHEQYEQYLLEELLPHVHHVTGTRYLILTGTALGAWQAVNFALRHPDIVNRAIGFSGYFDMRAHLDGYYDDQCYFHNPVDYLRSLTDPWYIEQCNLHCEFTLVTSDEDINRQHNIILSALLDACGIRHQLVMWEGGYAHDWHSWRQMIPHYI